ncbi:MAG: 4-alpha-glucanotransferase [Pyrinomonadaceae bacterium]
MSDTQDDNLENVTYDQRNSSSRVRPVKFPRASGVLLHPTSLPGPYGIGDLGPAAYAFADFLIAAGQKYWQVLPLGPTGYGDSPYQSFSAFAGNTNLVSPESLSDGGWLTGKDLADFPQLSAERVDFGNVIEAKAELLRHAFAKFRDDASSGDRADFEGFCDEASPWLNDYALFRAIKSANGGAAWIDWETGLAQRDSGRTDEIAGELAEPIVQQKFCQYLFFRHWFALKNYCNERGLQIIGDLPLFVAHDSVDVWTLPDQFKLNADGTPRIVAGVPPDYFSATGQLWGNPMYDWEQMATDGFGWWIRRLRHAFQLHDVVRLDHFRGLAACWEVPAGESTAVYGKWVDVPGRALLEAATKTLGELPLIAEDLGVITPEVEWLRDDLGYPGMRVLQFGFGSDSANEHLPHNYVNSVVAYTGTHDNDTTVGWFNARGDDVPTRDNTEVEREHNFALRYLNGDGSSINWDFVRSVWASVADTAIVPLQDLLGRDGQTRMNRPATESGNWAWRYLDGVLTRELTEQLREQTELYGRLRK